MIFKLKSGKSRLRLGGKTLFLKPGDTIEVQDIEDIPEGFRDLFEMVIPEGKRAAAEASPDGLLSENFKAVHKGAGRYAIINIHTDEQINEKLLSKAEAEAWIQDPTTAMMEEDLGAMEVEAEAEADELEGSEDLAE